MISFWEGKIEPHSVSNHISAFWDFLPTACDIAGLTPPEGIDGISMVPTMLGRPEQQKKHEFLYWELHTGGYKQAVRMGDWKAVRPASDEPLELYNLAKDPSEEQNVAARHGEVIAEIEAYLKTARTVSPDYPIKPGKKKS